MTIAVTERVGRPVVAAMKARGHEVVAMSRTTGMNVFTGKVLVEALAGVEGAPLDHRAIYNS